MDSKECSKCIHNAVCKTAESCDGYGIGCKHFNPGWISVKDRLPERFENVLCYFPEKDYGSPVMVNYNESTREEISVFADQYKWGKVTHWMPLPQPPKGE